MWPPISDIPPTFTGVSGIRSGDWTGTVMPSKDSREVEEDSLLATSSTYNKNKKYNNKYPFFLSLQKN